MPAHLDAPAPGAAFTPADFRVCGWLWLEAAPGDIVAVEVHADGLCLGAAAAGTWHERPDVSAKYGLPAGTRTGFEFSAHHPDARPDAVVELTLLGRRQDGSRTAPLVTRRLAPPPPERHPLALLRARMPAGALGLEIGAHTQPVAGLTPYYTDAVADYVGTAGRLDFLADARALPLADNTLDYLCSSHVLEHLADPLAALHEWHRVLRPGGCLYLVVPDKRATFDVRRALTPPEHVVRDFIEGPTAAGTAGHIDEFVFQSDWSVLRPGLAPAEVARVQADERARYLRELAAGQPIDIHYHTFTPDSVYAALHATGFLGGDEPRFELLSHADRYPPGRADGIALLLAKTGAGATDPEAPPAAERSQRFGWFTRAAASAGSFQLTAVAAELPPLPLVCPVSLRPLRRAAGGDVLVTTDSRGPRYALSSGRPDLLPPAGATPDRPWCDQGWRARSLPAITGPVASPIDHLMLSYLDEPAAQSAIDPLCFPARGWLWLGPETQGKIAAVEAWVGATLVGFTTALYERLDVTRAHCLAPGSRTGFDLFGHHSAAAAGGPLTVEIRARLADGSRTPVLSQSVVKTIARDYRTNHFGVLLNRETTAIQRHANIWAVGPSQSEGSGEVAALLRRHLGPPPRKLIDVGCGLGSYGRGLIADGYDWMGAEVSAADCAELARLGLPHRQVDGRTLPFADGAFDAALCIEVLEHIEDPRAFLREISRVAPRQLIVSVPNCELLGYLWDHLATPWHMLEATHTNFFTRWSLGALLREFYPQVELGFHTPYPLRTVEGTPLHYNLFAVASAL